MAAQDILILGGARAPFATWAGGVRGDGGPGGALKSLDPFDLGSAALREAVRRCDISTEQLDLVLFANMYHAGTHACYGARYVGIRAGVPQEVPCLTVSMACGSGLWALLASAQNIRLGTASIVGTGGMDNISLAPRNMFIPSFTDVSCGKPIGLMVEDLARENGISREDQDLWALRSHELALEARREGRLGMEIVAVGGVRDDDSILDSPCLEYFRSAQPQFGGQGSVTRANSHALVDGASALVLASGETTRRLPGVALGRFVGGAFIATAPERMGYASVPAIRKALVETRLEIKDIDLFEINETFAAQVLVALRELGIERERVNVNGGAIALGHPFAATGCRQVLSLLLELRRRRLKRGVASICVGGGQGIAVVVEAVNG